MADSDINTISRAGTLTGRSTGHDLFIPTGDATIIGYGTEDTIQFAVSSSSLNGDDVVLIGSNGTTVTVKNAKGHALGVSANGAATTYNYYGGKYDTTPQQIIQTFMKALDESAVGGPTALDEAITAVSINSDKKYTSMKEFIADVVADCKSAGNADTFLRDYCGIILDNVDTGAITGWDANGATTKTNISVVPESGKYDSTFTENSFTVNGVTLKLEKEYSTLTDVQKQIWQGLKTWWTTNSLELIKSSYGSNFSFDGGTDINSGAKTITVKFSTSGSYLAQVGSSFSSNEGTAVGLTLTINMKYYKSIDLSNVNGKSSEKGSSYLDRTLAHEFTHAIMAATINDFGSLPAYIKEGMAELTHGIDDERITTIRTLAGSYSKLNSALGDSTKTGNVDNYAGGYILLRYMAKKFSTFTESSSPQSAASAVVSDDDLYEPPQMLIFSNNRAQVTVTADNTDTNISAATLGSAVTQIDGTRASIPLVLEAGVKSGVLYAPSVGSTLIGGDGSDKLYGNIGSDTFVYAVGGNNDAVGDTKKKETLYQEGDKIVVVGDASLANPGAITFKDTKTKTDISFAGNKNKLTLNKAAADTPITVEVKTALGGNSIATISHGVSPDGVTLGSDNKTLTVGAEAHGTVSAAAINSQISIVDARSASEALYLVGNTAATAISIGASGGTLSGGAGADKLYGSGGSDVFIYTAGEGKDNIYNYDGAKDKVVLQGFGDTLTTITSSGSNINFKDNGSAVVLTLNSGDKKGTLTLNSPNDQLKVYNADLSLTDPILTYGVKLPENTAFNKNKTAVTLSAGTDSTKTVSIDLIGDGYPDKVKEIDASKYIGSVEMIGNDKAVVLRASKAGSTLDGGSATKATGDKLYGNEGVDTFVYKILPGIGGGTDVIGGGTATENYQQQDKLFITSGTGVASITADDIEIKDSKNVVTLSFKGDKKDKLTINKASSKTAISFYLAEDSGSIGSTPALTYGSMPSGVDYGVKNGVDYTTLSIGGAEANSTIDVRTINTQLKTINMSSATNAVWLIGNANANNITVGASGGTIDGGAGNDKIFGKSDSTVATTFFYSLGDGNDEINGYNGRTDVIYIDGFTDTISTDKTKKQFNDSGKDITITLSQKVDNTTKSGKLTIKSPSGKLTVVGKDESGNAATLLSYGANLPDLQNITINKGQMVIGKDASLGEVNTFKASDYGINVKEINASAYSTTGLYLIAADGKANILRAGGKPSTLQGGDGNDKLYGSEAADTFVYSVGGGADEIHSLNGSQGDEIILLGQTDTIDTTNKKVFEDKGNSIVFTLGGKKLTLKNPTGPVNVYSGSIDDSGKLTKGTSLLNYDSTLPSGASYNANRDQIVIGSAAASEVIIDASVANAYSSKLKTINASDATINVALTGNTLANELYASKGIATLNGGLGDDKLYGASKSKDVFVYDFADGSGGKDAVYNYDYNDGDVINLSKVSASGSLKVTYNGKTVVLNYEDSVGSKKVTGSLTVYGTSNGNKWSPIDTTTKVAIQIDGEDKAHYYVFRNTKIKNVPFSSGIDDNGINFLVDRDAPTVTPTDTDTSTQTSTQMTTTVEEYWFEDDSAFENQSPLDEIVSTDGAVDTDFDPMEKALRSSVDQISYSARHRKDK